MTNNQIAGVHAFEPNAAGLTQSMYRFDINYPCCGVRLAGESADEIRKETRVMWADLAEAVKSKKLSLPIENVFVVPVAKSLR
jgi:hypothetical protein